MVTKLLLNFSFLGLPAPGESRHDFLRRINTIGIISNFEVTTRSASLNTL